MQMTKLITQEKPIVITNCSHCNAVIAINQKFINWSGFSFCNENCIKESYSENLRTYGKYNECF